MLRYRRHFCLVSAQAIPNLVLVGNPETRPERVMLLTRRDMQPQAQWKWICGILAKWRVHAVSVPVDPFDPVSVRATVLGHRDGPDGVQPAPNVTGGTKVMARAANDAFCERTLPVFYVDTEHDQAMLLPPDSGTVPLREVSGVRVYLRGYGYGVVEARPGPADYLWSEVSQELIHRVERWAEALSRTKSLASQALEQRVPQSLPIPPKKARWKPLDEQLTYLAGGRVLERTANRVRFAVPEAAAFVAGRWLESHVLKTADDLVQEGVVAEACFGLQVVSADGIPNELDLVLMARNRLHIIECKTKQFARDGTSAQAAPVYKMGTPTQVAAGAYGRGMTASSRQIPDHVRQRCRDLHNLRPSRDWTSAICCGCCAIGCSRPKPRRARSGPKGWYRATLSPWCPAAHPAGQGGHAHPRSDDHGSSCDTIRSSGMPSQRPWPTDAQADVPAVGAHAGRLPDGGDVPRASSPY